MKTARKLLLLVCLSPLAALAQTPLRDPTRPPAALESGFEAAGGLRLEAVLRPQGGRPAALINGRTLALGAEIEGRRLVSVGDGEVALRGPEGVEVLRLVPMVEKNEQFGGRVGRRGTAGGER